MEKTKELESNGYQLFPRKWQQQSRVWRPCPAKLSADITESIQRDGGGIRQHTLWGLIFSKFFVGRGHSSSAAGATGVKVREIWILSNYVMPEEKRHQAHANMYSTMVGKSLYLPEKSPESSRRDKIVRDLFIKVGSKGSGVERRSRQLQFLAGTGMVR